VHPDLTGETQWQKEEDHDEPLDVVLLDRLKWQLLGAGWSSALEREPCATHQRHSGLSRLIPFLSMK
jgi:hypothetical protein